MLSREVPIRVSVASGEGVRQAFLTFVALLAGLAPGAPAIAQDLEGPTASDTLFARVDVHDDSSGQPRALQMAIVSYRPREAPASTNDGLQVDLIGAVHIGDRAYYEELNGRFENYDTLLFELVAPSGATVPQSSDRQPNLLSNVQLGMRAVLDLQFQLDEIDYSAGNFVHADLSPDEFEQSMLDRDESLYVYFWRAFYAGMREASQDPFGVRDLTALFTLLRSDDPHAMKTAMAYEMADVVKVSEMLDGADGSAIIAARNQHAMDVLEREIASGAKRIGIFYGVAHMPDFEQRLSERFGLEAAATQWVDAWRLQQSAQ